MNLGSLLLNEPIRLFDDVPLFLRSADLIDFGKCLKQYQFCGSLLEGTGRILGSVAQMC